MLLIQSTNQSIINLPALLFTDSVTLDKLVDHSLTQFSIYKMGIIIVPVSYHQGEG